MKLTDAEWQIMNALWKQHPATAREISERLPEGVHWAYTTIKTMLSRLKEKQAVSDCKQGNTSVYRPLISQDQTRQGAFRSLLSQAFEGAVGPLVHCLMDEKQLSPKQRQTLMEILAEEDP
ncbi:BlaI/MecI/CopY family transcriptional regulator [Planctomycetota bacterium]